MAFGQANFCRIATELDVAPLLQQLQAQPALWTEITGRQDYPGSPHHDTQAIFLRGSLEQTLEGMQQSLSAVDYPARAKLPEADFLIVEMWRRWPVPDVETLGRVMLAKLPPGGRIDRHADEGAYAEHYDRFHFVLTSEAGNVFECDGQEVSMQPGEVWWFDHRKPHQVYNGSQADRIHLIVDVKLGA